MWEILYDNLRRKYYVDTYDDELVLDAYFSRIRNTDTGEIIVLDDLPEEQLIEKGTQWQHYEGRWMGWMTYSTDRAQTFSYNSMDKYRVVAYVYIQRGDENIRATETFDRDSIVLFEDTSLTCELHFVDEALKTTTSYPCITGDSIKLNGRCDRLDYVYQGEPDYFELDEEMYDLMWQVKDGDYWNFYSSERELAIPFMSSGNALYRCVAVFDINEDEEEFFPCHPPVYTYSAEFSLTQREWLMITIKHASTGVTDTYQTADIVSCDVHTQHSLMNETLAADTSTVVIYSTTPISYNYADEMTIYIGTTTVYCKHYVTDITRNGRFHYTITGTSLVGMMISSKHYGGMYTGQTAGTIIADILQGISYTIDSTLAAATIRGYLPIASKRENLQQVLFATGGAVTVLPNGSMDIKPVPSGLTGTFDASKCFLGGDVEVVSKLDGVQLTEHNYTSSSEVVTLYNQGLDGTVTILFNEPYHDLDYSGCTGTVHKTEDGVNYCILQGQGTALVKGQKYIHVTRQVTAGTVTGSTDENIKTISDAYLCNQQIAQEVADRMYASYQFDTKITEDILIGGQHAGEMVSVVNPYTLAQQNACITELDVNISSLPRAKGKFVVGYTPLGPVSGFKNYQVLTGTGTFTVPSGVTKMGIVLVGPGHGGGGGCDGDDGEDGYETNTFWGKGQGGDGGIGGNAGSPGKIYEQSMGNVTPGTQYSYSCGIGGPAGEIGSTSQTEHATRKETTFGNYSSIAGTVYNDGYQFAFTQSGTTTTIPLAGKGIDGITGGKGGQGGYCKIHVSGITTYFDGYEPGENGLDVTFNGETYLGGESYGYYHPRDGRYYYNGGGGGAAAGEEGGNTTQTMIAGGDGADAYLTGATGTNYGQGGSGGHGGGGGGGGGMSKPNGTGTLYWGEGGYGGSGSQGGAGGNGCVIVMY